MNWNASELFSLKGKVVLLTGASGFLGRAMARALLVNGARVICLGRSDRLMSLVEGWAAEFGTESVVPCQVDMCDVSALEKALDKLCGRFPVIDVLINNAHELGPQTGFNTPSGSLEQASYEQLLRNFNAGVFWPALAMQKIGPGMKERGQGSIINIATMYALVAPSPQLYAGSSFINPPGYSAAKAGMMALTRYAASFWGPHGVRVNSILPGPFSNTEDTSANSVKQDDPFLERLRSRTCLGRVGKPAELVGAVLFLASDASTFVTGHGLVVDGGWTVV